uniref:GTPase RsgA n=1 Tax=Ignisphaera aggregans TaxID=334771 RepID=A0A7C2Z850_9CREN
MMLMGWKDLDTLISEVDIVLEVVEARNPLATRCGRVERLVQKKGKDLVLVLNKCDLVPSRVCRSWVEYLKSSEGVTALCFSSKIRETVRELKRTIRTLAVSSPVLVAVVGYPKVGKSSLINALKGRSSASTSPYPGSPGYTKVSQRYKIGPGIYLVDTPGVIPVHHEDVVELQLRAQPIDRIRNVLALASKLINFILSNNRYAFVEAYNIDESDPLRIMEELAKSRGWFAGKDREPNVFEAARAIIRDYLRGKIRMYVPPPNMT